MLAGRISTCRSVAAVTFSADWRLVDSFQNGKRSGSLHPSKFFRTGLDTHARSVERRICDGDSDKVGIVGGMSGSWDGADAVCKNVSVEVRVGS